MKKRIFYLNALLLLMAGGIFWSCQKDELTEAPEVSLKSGSAVVDYKSWCEEPSAYALIAGQTTVAGSLQVSNNGEYLKVEYLVNEGFNLGTVQLWVGTDPMQVPKNKKGIPVPGQFPLKGDATTGYVFYVPLPAGFDCATTKLYIYAHAEVKYMNGDVLQSETAWSEGTTFGTSRWGWYSTYTTCCEPPAGGGEECVDWQEETAFGGKSGVRIEDPGRWYYYFTSNGGEQNIYAGQTILVGTIKLVQGSFQITLNDGWELDPSKGNSVSIQGYDSEPANLEPKELAPGQFTTYKGASLTTPVLNAYNYYIIHLDVRKCTNWN